MQRISDAQIAAHADETHVQYARAAGQHVAGGPKVADAPVEGPTTLLVSGLRVVVGFALIAIG